MSAATVIEQEGTIQQEALTLATKAKDLKITNDQQYIVACEHSKGLATLEKNIQDWFKPLTSKAYDAWKALTTKRAEMLEPVEAARTHINREIRIWDSKKETSRLEAERQRRVEVQKMEDDERLAQAAELEKSGQRDLAEQVLMAPSLAPPVVEPRSTPQVKGVGFRDNWKVEVTDLMALVKGVAEGKVPLQAICADQSFLDKQARAFHGMVQFPGCRPYNDKTVATRTK